MNFTLSRKNLVLILAAIILAGVFLRAYNFSDWLHFELDQSRDARVIDEGLKGSFLDLPLLGPKAAGTSLRLPPGFYYLEYFGSLVFGGSPAGQAGIVLLFSIAAIPVFYLLFRRYFSPPLVLGLTALFSVSTFFVLYGRFAWNPNLLPFFLLFGFYALLRSVAGQERRPGRWFLLAALSLGLTAHFHFVAFIGVPIIAVLFLIYKRPRFSWRAWLGALGVLFFLFLPMILNDIEAQGRNTQEFFQAITKKSGGEEHTLLEKIVKNTTEQSVGYNVMLTGYEGAELPRFRTAPLDILCDGGCRQGLPIGLLSLLFYGGGGLALLFALYVSFRGPRASAPAGKDTEKEAAIKKDFLVLMGLWFAVTWLLFMNIAFNLAPRFFLLVTPMPFFFLGLILERIGTFSFLSPRKSLALIMGILLVVGVCNLLHDYRRLSSLARAESEALEVRGADRILKDRTRVTLRQQNQIIDFLGQVAADKGKAFGRTTVPIYMHSEPQHRRALKYLMEKRGWENDVFSPNAVYRQGGYFLILRSRSDLDDGLAKYLASFDVTSLTPFGTLTVIEFTPKPEKITQERQDFGIPEKAARDPKAAPRYTWRELWNRREARTFGDDEEE